VCLTKGLNWKEIETWLDEIFLKNKEEFYFDKSNITYIDERRVWYKTLGDALQGRGPCTYITQHY